MQTTDRVRRRVGALLGILIAAAALSRVGAAEALNAASTGCLLVAVSDSATGEPLKFVNVQIYGTKRGTVTDSLGRGVICGLRPGMVVVGTAKEDGARRRDTTWVERDRTATLFVTLGARPSGFWDPHRIRFGPPHRIDTPSKTRLKP